MKKKEVQNVIKPLNQLNLYGYSSFFELFVNLYKKNKIPNIILFSGPAGIGKATFFYHLLNYMLSINESEKYNLNEHTINESNNSYKLTCKNIHPNFFSLTAEAKNTDIKVDDIRNLLRFLHRTSYSTNVKYILIDSADKLNLNSSNSLLKILEEPPKNVFFFVISNNKKILPTIKSRSHEFKFFLTFQEKKTIFTKIIQDYNINIDIKKTIKKFYFDTPGNLINYSLILSKSNMNSNENIHDSIIYLIDLYRKDKNIELLDMISLFIEMFYNQLFLKKNSNLSTHFLNKSKISNIFFNMNKYNLNENNALFSIKDILKNESK